MQGEVDALLPKTWRMFFEEDGLSAPVKLRFDEQSVPAPAQALAYGFTSKPNSENSRIRRNPNDSLRSDGMTGLPSVRANASQLRVSASTRLFGIDATRNCDASVSDCI